MVLFSGAGYYPGYCALAVSGRDRQAMVLEMGHLYKMKPPREFCFRGGNFFVRAIDRSSVHLRVVIGIGSTGFRDLWISDLGFQGFGFLFFRTFGSLVFFRIQDLLFF